MIGPSRAMSFMQPMLVVLFAVFVVVNLYGYFTSEEDEDDTVTITFNCKHVLGSQETFPEFVVQQCKQLRMR